MCEVERDHTYENTRYPIRHDIKKIVKFGTPYPNLVYQHTDQLILDFSSMQMKKVYAVQSAINAAIKLCEHHMVTKVKAAQ